ncbi:MAG: hypothetical protein HQL53_04470 [Magnetococcales bacterium]|nr:hypothetical protein [Magnetococcales bacterium]
MLTVAHPTPNLGVTNTIQESANQQRTVEDIRTNNAQQLDPRHVQQPQETPNSQLIKREAYNAQGRKTYGGREEARDQQEQGEDGDKLGKEESSERRPLDIMA